MKPRTRLRPSQLGRLLLTAAHVVKSQPSLDYVFAVGHGAWVAFLLLTVALGLFGHLVGGFVYRLPMRWTMMGAAFVLGAVDAAVTVMLLLLLSKATEQPMQIIALSSAVWFEVWVPVLAVMWAVTLGLRIAEHQRK